MNKSGVYAQGMDKTTLRPYYHEITASESLYTVRLINGDTLYVDASTYETFVKGGPMNFYRDGKLVICIPTSSILYVIPPHKGE